MAFSGTKSNLLGFRIFMTSLAAFAFASGCAHVKSTPNGLPGSDPNLPAPKNLTEVLQQDLNHSNSNSDGSPKSFVMQDNGRMVVQGVELKNTRFDFPVTVNSRVEYWINYFTGRGRGYFQKYLERSEFFVPYIVPILRQNRMPEDLVYLAMIESGFNNLARSHAKAVGPWQFISATGKRYGLIVNWWEDDRRDIYKSTKAAVEYLRDLYTMFGSWELAAASYNAGEAKVARAVRRFGSKDFWVISRHRFLRPETRDYVPKIIAAAILSKNRDLFGFPKSNIAPGAGEAVSGDGEVVRLVKTDKPIEDSESKKVWQQDMDDAEMASEDDEEEDASTVAGAENQPTAGEAVAVVEPVHPKESLPVPVAKPIPTPNVNKKGEVGGEELVEFEVQSPADLLKIARAAGLSYQTVKALNPEVLRWCTPPTLGNYKIKLPSSVREKFIATYNHDAFPRKVEFMTYKARRGETLLRIARQFGIKVDPMSDLNGVSSKVPLRAGAKVLLPIPNDRSRTFASLEVRDPPEKKRSRHRRRRNYRITAKRRVSARSVGARFVMGDKES